MTPERLAEIRSRIGLTLNEAEFPYGRGGNGSHWAECWRSHIDCLAAWLGTDASELLTEVERLAGELARKDEALRRIEEDSRDPEAAPGHFGWIARKALGGASR